MSYSIHHVQENGLNLVTLKDDKTGTAVSILPQYGALLHSFSVETGTGTFNIIDNYNSSAQAKNEISKTFKSAKLSPFPCRILEGKYSYHGRAAEFSRKFTDGSTIHGLLYDKAFSVIQEFADESMASISLLYHYKNDDEGYPYKYKCHVRYSLHKDNFLQIQTTVTNESQDTIPIADGWHPYFQLGGSINSWQLLFKSDSILEFNDKLIPTGRLLKYDHFKDFQEIGSSEFDNCFVLNLDNGHAACELLNPGNKIKISFFPDNTYPYLQIFTPSHRKSIAIENLSAAPDCFNNNMGLTLLHPGHTKIFTVGYQVS